jgi:hypothetical protein
LQGLKHVYHSSKSSSTIQRIKENSTGRFLRFAIVGGGQSAVSEFAGAIIPISNMFMSKSAGTCVLIRFRHSRTGLLTSDIG